MTCSFWSASLFSSAVFLLSTVGAFAAERTSDIKVYGMDCPKCANGVAGSLKSLKGVKSAEVSVEKAQATVVYEDTQVTLAQIKKRIEENGFSITPKKAEHTISAPAAAMAKVSTDSRPVWCPTKSKGQLCGHGTADRLSLTGEKRAQWEAVLKQYNHTVEESQKSLLVQAEQLLAPEQVREVKAWLAPAKSATSTGADKNGACLQ